MSACLRREGGPTVRDISLLSRPLTARPGRSSLRCRTSATPSASSRSTLTFSRRRRPRRRRCRRHIRRQICRHTRRFLRAWWPRASTCESRRDANRPAWSGPSSSAPSIAHQPSRHGCQVAIALRQRCSRSTCKISTLPRKPAGSCELRGCSSSAPTLAMGRHWSHAAIARPPISICFACPVVRWASPNGAQPAFISRSLPNRAHGRGLKI
mmetsp:Transcript_12874/g.32668  ORF Transcript_12874/g.32668 Transcript_12874/m.32668 type:complete len:211 (-) Transcript_12874:705-1337(-)